MSPARSRTPFPQALPVLVAALLLLATGSAHARVLSGLSAPTAVVPSGSGTAGAGRPEAPSLRVGPQSAAVPGAWPLRPAPEVVRRFAPPPIEWAAGHRGVDLLGRPGQRVRAARAGTVTFAGRIAGRGVVVVSHGATRTTYEPVAAAVSRGEPVREGSVLGRLELLGSHCLPRACLHWGLVQGERYLDPLTLVGRGPVRLVPWDGLPVVPGFG